MDLLVLELDALALLSSMFILCIITFENMFSLAWLKMVFLVALNDEWAWLWKNLKAEGLRIPGTAYHIRPKELVLTGSNYSIDNFMKICPLKIPNLTLKEDVERVRETNHGDSARRQLFVIFLCPHLCGQQASATAWLSLRLLDCYRRGEWWMTSSFTYHSALSCCRIVPYLWGCCLERSIFNNTFASQIPFGLGGGPRHLVWSPLAERTSICLQTFPLPSCNIEFLQFYLTLTWKCFFCSHTIRFPSFHWGAENLFGEVWVWQADDMSCQSNLKLHNRAETCLLCWFPTEKTQV